MQIVPNELEQLFNDSLNESQIRDMCYVQWLQLYESKKDMPMQKINIAHEYQEEKKSGGAYRKCEICLTKYHISSLVGMNNCDHFYCEDCLKRYLLYALFE